MLSRRDPPERDGAPVRGEDGPRRPAVASCEGRGRPGGERGRGIERKAPDGRGRRQLAPGHPGAVRGEAGAVRDGRSWRRHRLGGADGGPPLLVEGDPVYRVARRFSLASEPEGPRSARDADSVDPRSGVEPHEVAAVGLHRPYLRLREARLGRDEVDAVAVGRPGGRAVAADRAPRVRHGERRPPGRVDDPDRRRSEPGRRGRRDVGERRRLERDAPAVGGEGGAGAEAREEARGASGGRHDPDPPAVLRMEGQEAAVGRPGGLHVVLAVAREGASRPAGERADVNLELPVRHHRRGELVAPGRERREELERAGSAERLRGAGGERGLRRVTAAAAGERDDEGGEDGPKVRRRPARESGSVFHRDLRSADLSPSRRRPDGRTDASRLLRTGGRMVRASARPTLRSRKAPRGYDGRSGGAPCPEPSRRWSGPCVPRSSAGRGRERPGSAD